MNCAISGQTSLWSSRGVHANGCGKVTVPSVGLWAVTTSGAVLPAATVIERGASHVKTVAPYCFGGGAVVGAGGGGGGEVCTGPLAGGTATSVCGVVLGAVVTAAVDAGFERG